MPPPTSRKVIYDTNIYIRALREGQQSEEYTLLLTSLPFTYLSSVVSAELNVGVQDSTGTRLVNQFVSQSERVGRVVTPTHKSWNYAGWILARILKEEPAYKSKLPSLFNDALIVFCALQIGATVCTRNEEDFGLIRRYRRFDLEPVRGLA